ncbi:efflux transporter outer membrane subunit [Paraburkholderia nemoris]|uniref:Efflux pump outer membrane protein TtgC n=1 Tax=Paraburkholderia nemoris TaxID=2793076 RepID=A0ABM8R5D3_9BURK|nr:MULTISPECIES: efflux transporter outer membrane subunit [Paraburkholderia]MBK5149186.1 efflux transporter outer membrane subunit [Burkholderia sp. R-69608]MBK3784566.1 efflux transporter outer membrane subunit [Paraburkholderia aspalathi]MBK3810547.1 efflux transporter outer membrane subunit [Paraburkholderia aspalathi]CAE6695220.1 putative efflux pump outer membrane protein TtgC [Paraburkholderia nemoris]CAE6733911.1 putative efflux pump outer membrane protein TtgC [Paraburkholderia nemori
MIDVIQRIVRQRRLCVALCGCAAVAGCMVGPDYRTPPAPATDTYTASPLPDQTASSPGAAGLPQRFVPGQDIPAAWWALFHCEPLDALIRQALVNSPNITAAQAALRQARENFSAQAGGTLLPSVDAQLGATREKLNGISFGEPGVVDEFNLYNASVNVSYKLDVFGGSRRELEALHAQIDYQRFQLQAAYLAMSANIVTAAVKEASLRAQIEATERIAAEEDEQLGVLGKQFELGGVGRTAVLSQQTLVAQTRATLPPLQQQLDQTRHQLAVLAGQLPSDATLPEFRLEMFSLPETLPVSLPSALVQQRPDILAADAVLHQASAQVGVATAAMYPQITLSASYGAEALTPAQVFKAGSTIWSLGAGLLQPVFHGGQLSAQKRAAEAAYEQANAQYRETVLLAFQNVADSLRALDHDATGLKAQTDAWRSASDSLELTRGQYRVGGVSYLALLDAQRQYQQTVVSLAQAQASRYADTAALFQALGGGWWNAAAPSSAATTQ